MARNWCDWKFTALDLPWTLDSGQKNLLYNTATKITKNKNKDQCSSLRRRTESF